MLEILVYALFCFFAAYGLITASKGISQAITKKQSNKNNGIQLVLVVKNHGDDIEGVIRNIMESDYKARIMADRELKVIDLGSEDDTLYILERLKEDYGNIEIVRTMSSSYDQLGNILESWII